MNFFQAFSLLVLVILLIIPELAAAQGFVTCSGPDCNLCSFTAMVNTILLWIIMIMTLVAVLLMCYAGFKLVVSTGDPGAMQTAKQLLLNVFIGFVIILAAVTIVDTLIKALAGGDLGVWNPAGDACGTMFQPPDREVNPDI